MADDETTKPEPEAAPGADAAPGPGAAGAETGGEAKAAEDVAGGKTPQDELKAALGHLKSAAGIFFGRIAKDDTLKKAAENAEGAVTRAATEAERALETVAAEAEKALKKLGERAEPTAKAVAKEIGDELGRVAKSVSTVFEPEPIPKESADDGEQAEAPAGNADGAAKKAPTEPPDDPQKT